VVVRCRFGTGAHLQGTAGNVGDVVEAANLLYGQATDVFGDAG